MNKKYSGGGAMIYSFTLSYGPSSYAKYGEESSLNQRSKVYFDLCIYALVFFWIVTTQSRAIKCINVIFVRAGLYLFLSICLAGQVLRQDRGENPKNVCERAACNLSPLPNETCPLAEVHVL